MRFLFFQSSPTHLETYSLILETSTYKTLFITFLKFIPYVRYVSWQKSFNHWPSLPSDPNPLPETNFSPRQSSLSTQTPSLLLETKHIQLNLHEEPVDLPSRESNSYSLSLVLSSNPILMTFDTSYLLFFYLYNCWPGSFSSTILWTYTVPNNRQWNHRWTSTTLV